MKVWNESLSVDTKLSQTPHCGLHLEKGGKITALWNCTALQTYSHQPNCPCINLVVFYKKFWRKSPRRSFHSCIEPSPIQRENKYNNGHQRLQYKNWSLKISRQCTWAPAAHQRRHFARKTNDIQEKFACCNYLNIWLIPLHLHQQMHFDMI